MKIYQFSWAQAALSPRVRGEWLEIGLDTAPVDPLRVREILGRLYAVAGRPSPARILHLDSPLQISRAISRLRREGEPVCEQVSDRVNGQVREQVRHRVTRRINEQADGLIRDRVGFESTIGVLAPDLQVLEHLREQVRENTRDPSGRFGPWPFRDDFGQFDVSLAWFDFVGRFGVDVSQLSPSFDLAKCCGVSVLFWEWAFISAKPQWIHRDEQGRLHCETGAAVRYPDGFSVFALHGVRVPEKVVIAPASIFISEIESERNTEVRRLMVARYGPERYLMESQAEEMHRDDFGVLYRKESPFDQPLVMVKVVNATPEPDGSFKEFFLRVPPRMVRARQAVAWTFAKAEKDYHPALQT